MLRRAAIRALGLLDGDSHVEALLRALKDDRSSVGRLAKEALRGRLHLVSGDRLWRMFERNRQPHGRRHVLAFLSGLGKWQGLTYLISACADDDPEIVARAQGHIRDWIGRFNRYFAAPTSEDLRRAAEALEASGSALDSEAGKRLRSHLEGW